jgi:hypothetical protein
MQLWRRQGAKRHKALLSFRDKLRKTQNDDLQLRSLHPEFRALMAAKKVEKIALLYL